MTTLSIHHRPAPFIAAAAAVAAIAAGSVALAASHDTGGPSAPGGHTQVSVRPDPPLWHHVATTSGGHVMLGN
ncbi:MAG TPA: hypothetical protein VH228_13595 [Nocardioides sp.]|jgi:hypothetical protein|nr:hypothetical protein [Nocardioides sp.]